MKTMNYYKTLKALVLSIFMGCSVLTQAQIYVDTAATGANDGSSWSNAYTDLQPALDAAAENAEIRVAAGTYTPTAAPDETTDDNRKKAFHFNRNLVLKGSYNPVTNTQDFANPSILSGDFNSDDSVSDDESITNNTENAHHVLITEGLTNAAQIEGFLITGGFANGDGNTISYSSKTFFNDSGAGMYHHTSSPSIVNTVVSGNIANFGGGMYNDTSSPSIVNTIVSGNITTNNGGGMYNDRSSSPSIVNTVVSGNSASIGGGMYNDRSSSPSIVNTVFSGNITTNDGGGMYNRYSSPSIVNTVFSGNLATNGGGMYNNSSSPSIVNTVFSGNSAAAGGGMFNDFSAFPSIVNSTFSGNTGSGISNANSSDSTIYNSVFYGNGVDIANSASSTATGGSNFSQNYTETGFTALGADPFYRSSDPIGADEVWFTDDDGLKPTIGSPIIDEGDATKLPSDTLDLDGNLDTMEDIPFDIRGRIRKFGDTVDVGAYEYDSTVLSVNDMDSSKLDIYSTGYKTLVIQGVFNAKTTANVYNLLGKLVASKTFDKFSTSNSLDVSTLPTGIYIVKMYNAKHQVQSKKLFIH